MNILPEDKKQHFLVCFGICLFFSFLFGLTAGIVITIVAGIGKEIYDCYAAWKETGKLSRSKILDSFFELIADGAGIALAILLIKIFLNLLT